MMKGRKCLESSGRANAWCLDDLKLCLEDKHDDPDVEIDRELFWIFFEVWPYLCSETCIRISNLKNDKGLVLKAGKAESLGGNLGILTTLRDVQETPESHKLVDSGALPDPATN